MTDFILEDSQTVPCTIAVLDKVGNIVPGSALDAGSVTATVADGTILTAVVAPDQSIVQVSAEGPEATDIVVTLDGTLNGVPISGSLAFDVTASAPASIGLIPGTPTEIVPPVAPPAPPVPDQPPAVTDVVDPTSGLPLYSFAGTDPTTIDTTVWTAVTDVTDAGAPLYTFSGDTAGQPPTGASAEWVPFDGTLTPVTPGA